MTARVAFVSIHYYPDYVRASCDASIRLAKRANARRTVFVANRADVLVEVRQHVGDRRVENASVLLHDNLGAEFGAFQAGLDAVLPDAPDWIIFANDTHTVHQSFSLVFKQHLLNCIRRKGTTHPCAVGQIESLPLAYRLQGCSTRQWLTTNLFALNAPALKVLGNQLYHPEVEGLIKASTPRSEFFSRDLDPVLAEHLAEWLFGQTGRDAWYAAEPLNVSSATKLAAKARSILQEKSMAALLVGNGAELIEVRNCNAFERLVVRLEKKLHTPLQPTKRP